MAEQFYPSHNNLWQTQAFDWPPGTWNEPTVCGISTGAFGHSASNPALYCLDNVEPDGSVAPGDAPYWWIDSGSFPYDQWVDIVVRVKWSSTNTGAFQVWKNGTQVWSSTGIRTLPNSFSSLYQELQWYHNAVTDTLPIYNWGVTVGTSYAAVDPATH